MSGFAALVLAAGQATRYRAADPAIPTKLVAELGGEPLVRHVVWAALSSNAAPVIVVTGHARPAVDAALADVAVIRAHNADFATGLASSLRAGVAAVPQDAAGAVVLLGDMPRVTAGLIDRLLAEAASRQGWDAIVPVVDGRRGNPVLLSRTLFPAVTRLEGDSGARHLLRQNGVVVHEVAVHDEASAFDIDEPRDLERLSSLIR